MNHIITKEEYLAVKAAWRQNTHHTKEEVILYNLLRGFSADRGFTPLVNPNKISNTYCRDKWGNFNSSLNGAMGQITMRDVSDETFAGRFPPQGNKPSFIEKLLSKGEPLPIMSEWGFKYQQRDIEENKIWQAKFLKTFGLELAETLTTIMVDLMKGAKK
jgi:hypothetical protein